MKRIAELHPENEPAARQLFLFNMDKCMTVEPLKKVGAPNIHFYVVWSRKDGVVAGVAQTIEKAAAMRDRLGGGDLQLTLVHKTDFLKELFEGRAMAMLIRASQ